MFPASLQDAIFNGDLDPGLKSWAVNLDAFSIGCDSNVVNGARNPGLHCGPGLKSGAVDLDAFSIGCGGTLFIIFGKSGCSGGGWTG
jgi:hypothetical protein